MFIIYSRLKCHIPTDNQSPRQIGGLQQSIATKISYYLKIHLYNKFQDLPLLSAVSVTPTSEVQKNTVLVLLWAGHYSIQGESGLQWHVIHTNFHEIPSLVQKIIRRLSRVAFRCCCSLPGRCSCTSCKDSNVKHK